jgi:hypothetical protein
LNYRYKEFVFFADSHAQALLALIPAILSVVEFPFWRQVRAPVGAIRRVQTTTFTIVLTGTALLIAAFIQASTLGLSVYHAIIVLYLSWLNNVTACAVLSFRWMLDTHQLRGTTHWQRIKSKEFAAYTLHLSATGALGIWLFSDVRGFDILRQCSDSTVLYVFGHYPRVAAHASRITWLVVYALAAVPLLNWILTTFVLMMSFIVFWICAILIAMVVVLVLICLCACCVCMPGFDRYVPLIRSYRGSLTYCNHPLRRITRWIESVTLNDTLSADPQDLPDTGLWRVALRAFPICWILFVLTLDIGLFVSTEQTIRRNNVGPGEGQWTFGQTLALLVVIFPMMDVWRMIRGVWDRRRRPGRLEESERTGDGDNTDGREMAQVSSPAPE